MGHLQIRKTGKSGADEMRFSSSGRVSGQVNMFKFQDRDTLQYVFYCPSLELSGYGETEKLAEEMVTLSIDDFFHFLSNLSLKDKEIELRKLGWSKSFFNKRFSKAFVDDNGELQNFNALDDKVERVTIAA